MIHIRIDDDDTNANRRFACGIGPELPIGDIYFSESERQATEKADCQGCNPGGPFPRQWGIPLSQVTGADLDRLQAEWYS